MDKFDALLRLQANWDSYGALAPDPRCVAKANELYLRLPGAWDVVPSNDGGVQLEQHKDGFDIELLVSPSALAERPKGDQGDPTVSKTPSFGLTVEGKH